MDSIELGELASAIGARSYERGAAYARGHRVLRLEWDPEISTLLGTVLGHGELYEAAAYFQASGAGAMRFAGGDCTCPVGYNCKHVAALVVAATSPSEGSRRAAGGGRHSARVGSPAQLRLVGPLDEGPARLSAYRLRRAQPARDGDGQAALAPAPSPPVWEAPLRALIRSAAPAAVGNPIALELSLRGEPDQPGSPPRLLARLMRPGARGGWIAGSLSWGALEPWQVRGAQLREEHLTLVRELRAIHRAGDPRSAYRYSTAASERFLDLGACDSPRLWPLLQDAVRCGMRLIHARAELGDVSLQSGEVALDVARRADGEGSLLRPVVCIDGRADHGLEVLMFVGAQRHGLVLAQPGARAAGADPDRLRLSLVALSSPAPPPLAEMALSGAALAIADEELDRFAFELWPSLRRISPVISSDGSFAPPEISAPELVLRVAHDETGCDVSWEWEYRVGDRALTVALDDGDDGLRDPAAESALLTRLSLADAGLGALGLLDGAGRPSGGSPVRLEGLDRMRLATEQLPALEGLDGIRARVIGEPPAYRAVDDSLEIALSATRSAGERDWFDLGVTISVEGRELPFAEVFVALAAGESRMLLQDGAHFSLQTPRLQALRRLIEEARALCDRPSGALRLSRYQAGLWEELVALGVVARQARAWRQATQALLSLEEIRPREVPKTLLAELRPYQREGFAWLSALAERGLGGILADDMGLGKTLQVLAMICDVREREGGGAPFLVVAPTSVVSGWVAEARRFAPSLEVVAICDTLARSGRSLHAVADGADLVVTTYTLLRLEADAYCELEWAGVVLDEAQQVKNHQAKTHRAARRLQSGFKLAVTGTPMENNLMELWSLLSIVAPGLFPDPARFAEHYRRPIEQGDRDRLELLRRRIRPLVRRRTKELVAADLPPKQEQTLAVELHRRHRRLYDTHLQRERQRILGLIGDLDRHRFTILRSITLLRQLSLHPALVDARHASVPCAKLDALCEQLREVCAEGHRALVFSQFTSFLSIVRERLRAEGIDHCYLDGSTRRRSEVIGRFRSESVPVFLISLKAGGFGLNLMEADYCFLLDPWWNPAVENQAIDRAHRIGQTRPVMVYRAISGATIEEKVVALAQRKAALFAGVMDEGDPFASALTAEDIRALVS